MIREVIVILMIIIIHTVNAQRQPREFIARFQSHVMSLNVKMMESACPVVSVAVPMVGLDTFVKSQRINTHCRALMAKVI